MTRMALFMALPQEHAPLRRLTAPWELVQRWPLRTFLKRLPDRDWLLIESGMGRCAIERALEWAFRYMKPDCILSAGFAGSLDERLRVGQVCLGEHYMSYAGPLPTAGRTPGLQNPTGPTLERFRSPRRLAHARVVTVELVQNKRALHEELGGASMLVDMETYYAAAAAAKRRVPFVSMRSVSDSLDDAIDFDVEVLTDAHGHIVISRVVRQVVQAPRILVPLLSAWKRSRVAGAALAEAARAFLSLPSRDIEGVLGEQHVSVLDPCES